MSDSPLDPFEFELSAMLKEAVADVGAPPGLATKVQLGIAAPPVSDVAPAGTEVIPSGPSRGWAAKLWATLRTPAGFAVVIAVAVVVAAASGRPSGSRGRSSRKLH